MEKSIKKLGIIAGGGLLPHYIADYCVHRNLPYFVLALEGFADAGFAARHPHVWQGLAKVGHAIEQLQKQEVTHLTLAGWVDRPSLSALKPDFAGMKLMGRIATLKQHGDDAILTELMRYLEEQGFAIVSPDSLITHLTVPAGILTHAKPGAMMEEDIKLGIRLLHSLGEFDVGQSAVVQQRKIIGIEAAEGTDRLIERVAPLLLKGEKATLVKIKKPKQDKRADMPAIGPDTLHHAHEAGLGAIAIEANATLVLDRQAAIEIADRLGLALVAVNPA